MFIEHINLFIYGSGDPVGLVIDYAVPISVTPLGPAVGEILSQTMEQGINYMEENYK